MNKCQTLSCLVLNPQKVQSAMDTQYVFQRHCATCSVLASQTAHLFWQSTILLMCWSVKAAGNQPCS